MKVLINIKADKDIKIKAQKTAKKIGLPLSSIMNAYLRHFVKTKEIYFSAEPSYRMTPQLEKTIATVRKDLKAGRNISKPFQNMEEAIAYLNS